MPDFSSAEQAETQYFNNINESSYAHGQKQGISQVAS